VFEIWNFIKYDLVKNFWNLIGINKIIIYGFLAWHFFAFLWLLRLSLCMHQIWISFSKIVLLIKILKIFIFDYVRFFMIIKIWLMRIHFWIQRILIIIKVYLIRSFLMTKNILIAFWKGVKGWGFCSLFYILTVFEYRGRVTFIVLVYSQIFFLNFFIILFILECFILFKYSLMILIIFINSFLIILCIQIWADSDFLVIKKSILILKRLLKCY
jgi:hypothetical protein